MNSDLKTELWKQFGASIDMFEKAIERCPETLWNASSKYVSGEPVTLAAFTKELPFWYIIYHTLFFLDYYLTEEPDKFHPPAPYTLSELDPAGIMPERVYEKNELLKYLEHCREKCRKLIGELTPEKAAERWIDDSRNYSIYEILLYNMRHVQHHTGQLNLLLGQIDHKLPMWVSQTKISL